MWEWKEKWFGKKCYVYMAGKMPFSKRVYFGFQLELTTARFELVLGFFGICIEW